MYVILVILVWISLDLFITPASAAPVERIFSTGGESTTGKRNKLTDSKNIAEKKISCTCNFIFHHTTFVHYIKTKTKTKL